MTDSGGFLYRIFTRYDFAVEEKEVVRIKPYPDSVLHTLDIMGMCREDAVYVGDSDKKVEKIIKKGIDRRG